MISASSGWNVSIFLSELDLYRGILDENSEELWSNCVEVFFQVESSLCESVLDSKLLRVILTKSLLKAFKELLSDSLDAG